MSAPLPAPASPPGPTPASPGNPDFAGMASQLAAIAARIDTLKQGTLTLPANINTFVNQSGQTGVGIEPNIGLDQEAGYINHLHQLRRVNAGDDLTDLAGDGLYLMRLPITLMPGPESRKGKGAIVTVEARHDLTEDLLVDTFRDVAILDLTYAPTQTVNEQIHRAIYEKSQPSQKKKSAEATKLPPGPPWRPRNQARHFDPPNNVSGPDPTLLRDLQLILGSIDEPTGGEWSDFLRIPTTSRSPIL